MTWGSFRGHEDEFLLPKNVSMRTGTTTLGQLYGFAHNAIMILTFFLIIMLMQKRGEIISLI